MKKPVLGSTITLRLTGDEINLVYQLSQKGITQVSVFRRGLQAYEADLVGDLTQNNIS